MPGRFQQLSVKFGTKLPGEIERLRYLETLHVAGTQISQLPTEIGKLQHLETLDVSGAEVPELPTWIEKLQSLKTLDVSGTEFAKLPSEIMKLERLETLDLSRTRVTDQLAKQIGELQHLRTLDISRTRVREFPKEIGKLQHLETLDVSWTMVRELPKEIGKLQHLRTLNISRTRVRELPKEIRKLQHLSTLDISGNKVRELPCSKDQISFLSVVFEPDVGYGQQSKLPLDLISPCGGEDVISSSEAKYRGYLSILVLFNYFGERCDVLPVGMLRVAGRHMRVPQRVKNDLRNVCSLDIRLCKLEEEDLEILKTQMPNLRALQLRFEVLPWEPVAITDGGFSKLETFYVDCRLPRVISFKEAATPKLKHLEFKFYTGPETSQDYCMGIKHLDSLEKVVFRCSEYYTSYGPGISATINAVRNEVAKHPNEEISLWVNDNIFVRHARDKEKEALMETEERRKSHLLAAEKRAQRDKYRGREGIRS